MLLEFLQEQEGKCLEFKQDVVSTKRILETIIAFSNTSGGKILIGIEDETRHIVGVENPTDMEMSLANCINDSIYPQIAPNIEIISWQNKHVLMIEVFPGMSKPYFLKSKGEIYSTYIRVGSTNRQADSFMIDALRRTRSLKTYDEELMPEIGSEVIDFRLASELFAYKSSFSEKHLLTLGVLASLNEEIRPTVGGILLFSQHKTQYFPDAWIQAGFFQGTDKTDILDTQDITAPLAQAVDKTMDFIRKHVNVRLLVPADDLRHREVWSIPYTAIREAVINAIVHADYSLAGSPIRIAIFEDRLEIENPGLLPFGLRDIKEGISKIRNRIIARVFRELGLIERWGSGVQRILRECREAGLAEPCFEEIGTHFRVTFYKKQIHPRLLDDADTLIVDALRESGQLSTKILAQKIHLSDRQTRTRLIKLLHKGIIGEIARGKTDPEKKYFLKIS